VQNARQDKRLLTGVFKQKPAFYADYGKKDIDFLVEIVYNILNAVSIHF